MPVFDPFLIRSSGPSGEPVVRLGVQLLDDYLDFVAARCRPNKVLATAYDLLVFFRVVDKPPEQVNTADVLAFIYCPTARRTSGSPSNPRAPRALVNLPDKVPLHWNRTSSLTNTPASRENIVSTTKE